MPGNDNACAAGESAAVAGACVVVKALIRALRRGCQPLFDVLLEPLQCRYAFRDLLLSGCYLLHASPHVCEFGLIQ